MTLCCCCCWRRPVAFSKLGATGMWYWHGELSAVWRITLVAMDLQGGAIEGGLLATEVAAHCEGALLLDDEVSVKLGL